MRGVDLLGDAVDLQVEHAVVGCRVELLDDLEPRLPLVRDRALHRLTRRQHAHAQRARIRRRRRAVTRAGDRRLVIQQRRARTRQLTHRRVRPNRHIHKAGRAAITDIVALRHTIHLQVKLAAIRRRQQLLRHPHPRLPLVRDRALHRLTRRQHAHAQRARIRRRRRAVTRAGDRRLVIQQRRARTRQLTHRRVRPNRHIHKAGRAAITDIVALRHTIHLQVKLAAIRRRQQLLRHPHPRLPLVRDRALHRLTRRQHAHAQRARIRRRRRAVTRAGDRRLVIQQRRARTRQLTHRRVRPNRHIHKAGRAAITDIVALRHTIHLQVKLAAIRRRQQLLRHPHPRLPLVRDRALHRLTRRQHAHAQRARIRRRRRAVTRAGDRRLVIQQRRARTRQLTHRRVRPNRHIHKAGRAAITDIVALRHTIHLQVKLAAIRRRQQLLRHPHPRLPLVRDRALHRLTRRQHAHAQRARIRRRRRAVTRAGDRRLVIQQRRARTRQLTHRRVRPNRHIHKAGRAAITDIVALRHTIHLQVKLAAIRRRQQLLRHPHPRLPLVRDRAGHDIAVAER